MDKQETVTIDVGENCWTSALDNELPSEQLYLMGPGGHTEQRPYTGSVTIVTETFGYIDREYRFDYPVPQFRVTVGDIVSVILSRMTPLDKWKVKSFLVVVPKEVDTTLEKSEAMQKLDAIYQEIGTTYVAKVVSVDQTMIVLETSTRVWDIHLGSLECDFTPVEGDWVIAETVPSKTTDGRHHQMKQLHFECLKPMKCVVHYGVITLLCGKFGVVDLQFKFDKSAWAFGYEPQLHDTVEIQAIQSDQGEYAWRVVRIVPRKELSISYECTTPFMDLMVSKPFESSNIIALNKNVTFTGLKIRNVLYRSLIAINVDAVPHKFCKVNLLYTTHSQFSISAYVRKLLSSGSVTTYGTPAEITLNPGESLQFMIKCEGKIPGSDNNVIILHFDVCQVAKKITAFVLDE